MKDDEQPVGTTDSDEHSDKDEEDEFADLPDLAPRRRRWWNLGRGSLTDDE